MLKAIDRFAPQCVVIDPVTTFVAAGSAMDAQAMLIRLVDVLKAGGITACFTSLIHGGETLRSTEVGMSSLMDTWLLVRDLEADGERNRLLYVLKSRGMAHSNQVREFLITSEGIQLRHVYLGAQGMLTGTARSVLEEKDRSESAARAEEAERSSLLSDRRASVIEAQIAALQAELTAEKCEQERQRQKAKVTVDQFLDAREQMARSRGGQGQTSENS
jgi:circadian clock protein KaiC